MSLEITLEDGISTISLPPDMEWQDEFAWTAVEQSTEYTLTGSLVVQQGERQDGRPVTLFGGREAAWISRDVLQQLYAMANQTDLILTLTLWGTEHMVMFRSPPITAEPIRRQANPGPDHQYAVTINLMKVTQ